MDCRTALVLALGLLVGISGCTTSTSGFRLGSSSKPKEDITHKASTYVAFGEFRAKSAQSQEHTAEQRQQFRDDARLSYLKAIEVDSNYLPAYVALAQLQQSAEDHAGAAAVYAKAIGVDIDQLLISQPDTGEQALEIADMLIRSGALDVVVIDSVAALTPRAEIEGEMGDSHVGLQARLMSQALRKLTSNLNKSNTIAIF